MIIRALIALTFFALGCDAPSASPPSPSPSAPGSSAPADSGELGVGAPAPAVTLTLTDQSKVSLRDLAGSMVLVYFYPKDDTPGCTVEAKGFSERSGELGELGVKIYGVSMQDATSHQAFIDKHALTIPLVVDDGTVAAAFGVPVRDGKAARQSFLIGRDGKLLAVWRSVTPSEHVDEVLAAVRAAPPAG